MPYSVIDQQSGEIFAVYASRKRAEREAAKDPSTVTIGGTWRSWLRFAVKPPVPFIVFMIACVIAAVIAVA